MRLFRSTLTSHKLLLALPAILVLLLAAAIVRGAAPRISTVFEGATVDLTADKAWSILPGDCIQMRWELEGIKSLYIDGEGKIGWGELTYCPAFGNSSPAFRVTAQNGEESTFRLETYFLPQEIANCLLFVFILSLFGVAVWYFWSLKLDEPPPVRPYMLLVVAVIWIACLLATATGAFSIVKMLAALRELFTSNGWQYFGIVLAAVVFVPLLIRSLRHGIKTGANADFVAISSFLVFLLLLYAPFGFESIPLMEGWLQKALLEGSPSEVANGELVTRFFALVPYAVADELSPHSFAGYHVVNVILFWLKLALFYGILRRLTVTPFLAFLCTMLFMVFPVSTLLLSLRSLVPALTIVTFFAALYLTLGILMNRSRLRLRLAGVWLAMLFAIGSHDLAYGLIVAAPLIWWWRNRSPIWFKANLTAIWFLPFMAKVFYVLLLFSANQNFRGSALGDSATTILFDGRPIPELVVHYVGILGEVYLQTLVLGWQEAYATISLNAWIPSTVAMLALTGLTALWLARHEKVTFPTRRRIAAVILGGLALVLPSVGVVMWFEKFNRDLWRMYILVPIGAAIALLGLVLLIASLAKTRRIRVFVIVSLCLLLMFPAISRLFLQKASFETLVENKAYVVRQIAELAPRFEPEAFFVLLTDMGLRGIGDNQLWDFRRYMFNFHMRVIYHQDHPEYSVLCWNGGICNAVDWGYSDFKIQDVIPDSSKLVVFRLHEDLSVEVLHELPSELGITDAERYDPLRLIDTSAPLPRRAVTMLGAGQRLEQGD